jgi:hypothetical protein
LVFADDDGRDFGTEVNAAGKDGADGVDELAGGVDFEDVPGDAGLEGFVDEVGFGVGGQDDDFDVGVGCVDGAGQIDAAEAGHLDIGDDDVGLELFGGLAGGVAGVGLADDFEVGLLLEEEAEAVADDLMVVNQEDSGAHFGVFLLGLAAVELAANRRGDLL